MKNRENRLKRLLQEGIDSILEMNGDGGIGGFYNSNEDILEERLFPELSDRKYNELLWFTSPNMTANAYTKFFGKEMVADRIPAKYLVSIGKPDEVLLNHLVEKHRKLYDAKQVKPIADYKDFDEFIKDLNSSKYLSRNDKSNIAKSGAKIIKSFGDWDLYDITSWAAAKKYGSGTTWCVTTSDRNTYFKKYVGGGKSDSFGGYNKRKLFFVINPGKDRKFAIAVSKSIAYNWYSSSVEFYNEEDYVFYDYDSSVKNITLTDNISKKFYENTTDVDIDEAENYGEDESFFVNIMNDIKNKFKMNKEQVIKDMDKLRQEFKQLMNIKESYNKFKKFGMSIKNVDSNIHYKDGKGVVYNALDEELVNENDMIYNFFYKDLPLLESEFLMMKDDDTRFGGVYDVNTGEVYYFPKNIVHNEDEIRKSLKDGIVKFSYYKINEKIVGGILAYDKENAMKTIKYLDKQQKSFEPEYYMLELDNGKGYKYINVTANGKEVYENISRDYIGSRENIRKMVIESSHRLNDDMHNMTCEEFVEKVGRENEFDGSVVISKHNIEKPSPNDLNKTKINENYKKLSDESGVVEVFSYNDIKGFVNRCRFGARGLLNKSNNRVYLADSFESYHGDMVDELANLGDNINYDYVVRFMVYNDKFKALDSEYGEEYRNGNHSISILTNGDLYVLFKDYDFMNDALNNILKLDTMEDLEDEDEDEDENLFISLKEGY